MGWQEVAIDWKVLLTQPVKQIKTGLIQFQGQHKRLGRRCHRLGYHRKAGQKGTSFLFVSFVSPNLPRFKRVPIG
jgi:hypothetical protein